MNLEEPESGSLQQRLELLLAPFLATDTEHVDVLHCFPRRGIAVWDDNVADQQLGFVAAHGWREVCQNSVAC